METESEPIDLSALEALTGPLPPSSAVASRFAGTAPVVLNVADDPPEPEPEPEPAPVPETPEAVADHIATLQAQATLDPSAAFAGAIAMIAQSQAMLAQTLQSIDAGQKFTQEQARRTRQLGPHEIKKRTAWNPTGAKLPALVRMFSQGGAVVQPDKLWPKEIELINRIAETVKPTTGTIERDGMRCKYQIRHPAATEIDISYDNATIEQRMNNTALFGGTFAGACEAILADVAKRKRVAREEFVA